MPHEIDLLCSGLGATVFVGYVSRFLHVPSPPLGRSNGVMGGIAKQFSNAELKALSSYIASVDGDLKVVPERKFR